MNGLVVKGIVK